MSASDVKERRLWPRVSLDAAAIIRVDTLSPDIKSRIVNASANGLLLAMPAPRPIGTRMHVRVKIGDPETDIAVSGIIVHVSEAKDAAPGFGIHVGVYLTQVSPAWLGLCQKLAEAARGT